MKRFCLWAAVWITVLGLCAGSAGAEAPRRLGDRKGDPSGTAPGVTVYYCTSKLAGVFPKVGPICHASVVFCPVGELPVVCQKGVWVSNPRCAWYGTQPFKCGFLKETKQRREVSFCPVATPAHIVLQRVKCYDRPWRFLWNNCMHGGTLGDLLVRSDDVHGSASGAASPPGAGGLASTAGQPPAG